MNAIADWMDHHTGRAPAILAARTRAYVAAAGPATSIAERLAAGARDALHHVVAQPGDRSAALDLLAADALLTLALLEQAERAPHRLGDFARGLLRPDFLAS